MVGDGVLVWRPAAAGESGVRGVGQRDVRLCECACAISVVGGRCVSESVSEPVYVSVYKVSGLMG
jgi:hypothetical protein